MTKHDVDVKHSEVINVILDNSKKYNVNDENELSANIRGKYGDIIYNHLNTIMNTKLFDENKQILIDTIIERLDKEYIKKEKKNPTKKPRVKYSKEEKQMRSKEFQRKKEERKMMIHNGLIKPKKKKDLNDKLFHIPILVEMI